VTRWLAKQEPSAYSFGDLERDRETEWEGVHNALALRHLRSMTVGDLVVFYHSGSERACVGIMRVVRGPLPDPSDARGSWTVRVAPVRRLPRPVPLEEIRRDPLFDDFDLVRISRLSVMPVSERQWHRLLTLAEGGPPPTARPTGAGSGRARASASRSRERAGRRRR
jgi:predicted RNA-binding protein with PUA-like domain